MNIFMTIGHIQLNGCPKPRQLVDQLAYVRFHLCCIRRFGQGIAVPAQDQIIQRHVKQLGKLYEQIHRTSFFARFNAAIIALVDIQRICGLFLCKPLFDAELADAFSALFHVIIQLCNLQSVNLWVLQFEIRDHGYLAM